MPPFQEWIVQLIEMISNALVGVAALVGILGIWQWRREMVGKTRYELARKIVKLALQYEEQVNEARNPFTYPNEATERTLKENETDDQKQVLDESYARWKRFEPIRNTLLELRSAIWESELLFKDDEVHQTKSLINTFADLTTAYTQLFSARLHEVEHVSPLPSSILEK